MAKKYLDYDGLLYFWQKIKTMFSSKSEGVKNITRSGTTFTVTRADDTTFTFTQQDNTVAKTTTTPKANGTAAIGSETKYAAGDHVHPLQTSVSGNAGTATKLEVSKTIDGVLFDGSANIIHYGSCSTAAGTTAKAVTCVGFTLALGAWIAVKFTVTNTGAVGSLQLNVNGTGAKAIKYRGGNLPSAATLTAGRTYLFVYDGTNYELVGDLDTNTTYTAASATPSMDGTGAVGSSAKYAREDHVHPSDTSRVPITRTVNGMALSSNISVEATDINSVLNPGQAMLNNDITEISLDAKAALHYEANETDYVVVNGEVDGEDVQAPLLKYNANKGLSTNDYTTAEKTKLAGIASGAEVNVQSDWNVTDTTSDAFIKNKPTIPTLKNVFGKVKVGTTTIEADTTQDTLELAAGSNVTLTPDATNDKVTIAATNTTYSAGTAALITAGSDTSNRVWQAKILHDYIASAVEAAQVGAATFKGTVNATADISGLTNYKKGWYWVVGTAGTYAGQVCEAGDMIFCISDYSSSFKNADFDVVQTNLDITSITNAEIDTILAA